MNSDAVLRNEGMRILTEQLGPVRAERFIALMIRDQFDYTEWQQGLFPDVPIDKFLEDAMNFRLGDSHQ